MTETLTGTRHVARSVRGERTLEGAGFVVRRPFPIATLDHVDPFLLLDEMGPMDVAPGEAKGAPDHPHRGFETVTYLLEGSMEHEDSSGNAGKLRPGDVQWMTAGRGVIHSEMPSRQLQQEGGRMHGFQLWVNLPRADKLIAPRYQDTASAKIPVVTSGDGKVRAKVIAGEALGAKAVIDTRTPIVYVHFTLQPGARHVQPVPQSFNAFAYVFRGAAKVGEERLFEDGELVVLRQDGDQVVLEVPADAPQPAEVLLVAGQPLREPVVRYGPFVMNSRDEIVQAITDYQTGRFGEIAR